MALIFFYPVIIGHKTFYAFDLLNNYYPWKGLELSKITNNFLISDPINGYYHQQFYLHSLLTKQNIINNNLFSFWNPYNFCGTNNIPIFHIPYIFVFLKIYSVLATHDLILFIHLILSGCFIFMYFREIKLEFIS